MYKPLDDYQDVMLDAEGECATCNTSHLCADGEMLYDEMREAWYDYNRTPAYKHQQYGISWAGVMLVRRQYNNHAGIVRRKG